jgi:L-amino acid N-acyltransferase YncA
VKLVDCEPRRHAAAILAIFNEAIANSTALYDYALRTPESMESWFAAKARNRYPVIGLENEDGALLGFATYGMFRERPAYKYTVGGNAGSRQCFRVDEIGKGLRHLQAMALGVFGHPCSSSSYMAPPAADCAPPATTRLRTKW